MSELRARVISQEKGLYQISSGTEVKQASVSGKFRYEAQTVSDYPAVGDYVLAEWQGGRAPATDPSHILMETPPAVTADGHTCINLSKTANIDTVFLCMSLNQNFNLRRLERYLSIAYDSGAEPVVVLTKADLCQDPEDKLAQVRTAAPGAEILTVSSLTGDTDAVLPYILPGRTVAFLGSSGVGKSTLINKLMGTSALATGAVGTADKGRHTTTHRQLLTLPNGAFLIDTPGMRELGMWDSDGGIDTAFQDLLELTRACRFSNCTHTAEPGCAVLKALADGTLDAGRWESFRKLKLENASAAERSRYLDAKREKFKSISKTNKTNRKSGS